MIGPVTETPILVLGAGLAGSAAAVVLGQAGHAPLLIEREAQPVDKVCGCFLSVEAVSMLEALGVSPDRLGASHINRVRLVHQARMAEAALPFPARGLSRKLLDAALLDRAAQAGADVRPGVQATSVEAAMGGVQVNLRGAGAIRAETVFLATGKHDVRGAGRPVDHASGNIGFKQLLRLAPAQTDALRCAVELYLFDGGYAGLQLVEGDAANLCLVIERNAFQQRGSQWAALIAALAADLPLLATRLAGAAALTDRPLAISHIPYGFVHRASRAACPGLYRLGDQAAVIPSFSGDGMAIALHSGMAAAQCYVAGGSAADFHAGLQRRLAAQFRTATLLQRMAASAFGRQSIVTAGGLSPALMRWAAQATRLRVAVS